MASGRSQKYEAVKSTDHVPNNQIDDGDSGPLLTPTASSEEDTAPKTGDRRRASLEQSPFLEARKSTDEDDLDDPLDDSHGMEWSEEDKEETKSLGYLFILTLSIAGYAVVVRATGDFVLTRA